MDKKNQENSKRIQTKSGVVVSDSQDKTRVVLVSRYVKHKIYQKRYLVTKKFTAHDPENKFKTGDRIVIEEMRPLSKVKKWIVKY